LRPIKKGRSSPRPVRPDPGPHPVKPPTSSAWPGSWQRPRQWAS
jgi:hypothetical protein